VGEVKAATPLPVIVNGDVTDDVSARAALLQSGADAIMIGRGAYGRPWIATAIDSALRTGNALEEPGLLRRLEIVLDHLADSLRFYGDAMGLRIFRKHLGWYVENARWPLSQHTRRAAKAELCRLTNARDVEAALIALWREDDACIDRAA
jgi:tRNA-dihydrouridine synthase